MKKLNMKTNTYPGALISFCGLDGCGKSTMIKWLATDLQGKYNLYLTKQPTDAVRNSDIFRTYMDAPDHSAYEYRSLSLLAASDRIQHVNKVIAPQLGAGNIVICDRYFYSCLANLRARGFEYDRWIYEISSYVIKPDVAIFLDVPVDVAVARVRGRIEERERYIDIELQHKLRREYIDICKANGGLIVSTELTCNETYDYIKNEVTKILEKKYGYREKSDRNY